MSQIKQIELLNQYKLMSSLHENDKHIFWEKLTEEADNRSEAEKQEWQTAIVNNLKELKEKLVAIEKRANTPQQEIAH
ncbi:MAG: hypothetical protein MUE30_19995 [Spirosomaceae bacterium]|nr:hypothetical protein [Spirosomataceae bacterium]